MGLISIVISVAPAVGPTISGLILHVLPWRWLFIIVLPIAAAALILGALVLKNIGETRRVRVDAISVVLSVFGFGGLVYGLSAIGAAASGTAQVSPAVPLVIGGVSLAVFIWRQTVLQRTDEALLDLRPFTVRTFTVSIILVVVLSAAFFGVLILMPLYVQNVLGWDTLGAGLMLLPGGVVMGISSEIVGRLYDRFGPSPLVIPGSIVVSGALWVMTTFGVGTATWMIVTTHVFMSIGLAFMFTPLMTNALGALPKRQYSYGSAILSTLQQVAGGAGTALLITVMTLASAKSLEGGAGLVSATADGIHAAFLVAAFLSLGVVAMSFLVKRAPAEEEEQGVEKAPVDAAH